MTEPTEQEVETTIFDLRSALPLTTPKGAAAMLESLSSRLAAADKRFDDQCELLQAYAKNDRAQHDALAAERKDAERWRMAVRERMIRDGEDGIKSIDTFIAIAAIAESTK